MNSIIEPSNNINRLSHKEQFWQEQITQKQKSGLSRAAYCRKHQLNYDRFVYWERKYTNNLLANKLLPVKLNVVNDGNTNNDNCSSKVLCTLALTNGSELKIFNLEVLPLLFPMLKQ
jgi:hypothetical protein